MAFVIHACKQLQVCVLTVIFLKLAHCTHFCEDVNRRIHELCIKSDCCRSDLFSGIIVHVNIL